MNRRTVLAGVGVNLGAFLAGCTEAPTGKASAREQIPSPEEDQFPLESSVFDRGQAETFVEVPEETTSTAYGETSGSCASDAMGAVSDHLNEAVGNTSHIRTAWGNFVPDVEFRPVIVRFIVNRYVDGDLESVADLSYEEVLAATPSTAYITNSDGELVCYTPVYAEKKAETRIWID